MGHNNSQGDRIMQSFATVAGQKYTVSFWFHCIQGNAEEAITGDVIDGITPGPELGMAIGTVSSITQGWIEYSFSFTAVSNMSRIRFTQTQAAADANIALDSITVIPATATAFIGLIALLSTRRRRAA
jgi:hypothetical protein